MLIRRYDVLSRVLILVCGGLLLVGLIYLLSKSGLLIMGIDWRKTYRPAALALLQFRNPYAPDVTPDAPFVAAPWSLFLLIPFAVFPYELSHAFFWW